MGKVIGGQKPFRILVANLRQGSDPSIGPAGNPVKLRTSFLTQNFIEANGFIDYTPEQFKTPGLGTKLGLATYTVPGTPVPASGSITVASVTFAGETFLVLGPYTLSTYDIPPSGAVQATASIVVTANPSTATITIGGQALTPAAGARTPGNNDYNNTLGSPALIAADIVAAINDGANSFGAIAVAVNAGGGSVDLEAIPVGAAGNAVTLASSDGTVTVSGATFSGGLDADENYALFLAQVISASCPPFAAVAAGNAILVSGPVGPIGNETAFYATGASPGNFTFSPDNLRMAGAEPFIGPYTFTT
jgi:hypothetical protein